MSDDELMRRDKQAAPLGVKPDGSPDIMTEEEPRRRMPLIRKAHASLDPADWEAAAPPVPDWLNKYRTKAKASDET
jgi:hypothetical protein